MLLSTAPAMAAPSDWLLRWAHLLPAGSRVLDLACGAGRHTDWLAAQGHRVTAVDRDAAAVAAIAARHPAVEALVADLEDGPWPLAARQWDAVLVTRYLWRPRAAALLQTVRPGGWLLYETFSLAGAGGQGRPSRPDFLLREGELLDWLRPPGAAEPAWHVLAFEDACFDDPPRFVQRIVGQRAPTG